MIDVEHFNINRDILINIHEWCSEHNIDFIWDEYWWYDFSEYIGGLKENCTMGKFSFKTSEEAILFKLRWF